MIQLIMDLIQAYYKTGSHKMQYLKRTLRNFAKRDEVAAMKSLHCTQEEVYFPIP